MGYGCDGKVLCCGTGDRHQRVSIISIIKITREGGEGRGGGRITGAHKTKGYRTRYGNENVEKHKSKMWPEKVTLRNETSIVQF
jgi:hypothetical protein